MSGPGVLAIVPARAGSKRLPDKNIAEVGGVPLLVRAIRSAQGCPGIVRTVVSTDSERYQHLAIEAGASCPTLRSATLAADTTTSADVVLDVLNREDPQGTLYKAFVLLQPTSPLRSSVDVSSALELFMTSGGNAVVSVSEAECPPAWIGQLSADGMMDDFVRPASRGLRSQDLGAFYRLNGAIYILDCARFRANPDFMPPRTRAYVMPRERAVDIDNATDLALARAMYASNIVE